MDENEKQKPKVHYVHVKKRRIHLDSSACEALSQSEEGSRALTQPQSIPHSSRDPNRGLYPRPSGGFRSASQVMNSQGHASALAGCANKEGNGFQTASQVMQSQGRLTDFVERKPNAGSSMKRNTRAKLLSPQSNTLNNYFKPVQKSPIKIYSSPVKKVPGSSLLYTMEPSQPQKLQPPAAKQKPKKKLKYDKAKALSQSQHEWLHEREKSEEESAKTFGLLGDAADAELIDLVAESDEEEEDYFASVPDEILENILCQLPLQDLCLNANRVCLRWSSIISGAKFIPWKKRYHKYLKDHEVMADVTGLAEENEMTDQMTCFLSLFRFMKSFKLVTAPDMLAAMRKHPKWSWAEDFAKEKTKLFKEDLSCHPWAMLTLLVFVSECVDDILEVIRCLVGSHSQCLIHEVLESLYCVALFLLHFKKTFVNCYYNVLHYRVYYALYLYENESAITCGELSHQVKGQQTIDRYAEHSISVRLTHEQLRICNHDIQEGDTIKIIAFAGTGKTTTLIKYTQLRPGLKFLLIVYNKAINEHSKQCFPLNVTCRTAHSLAYQKIGRRYAAVKKLYNLKIMDIVDRLTARQGISLYVQAKFVRDAIMAFLASADRVIDMDHVPSFICEEDQVKHELNAYQRLAIVDDANSMWKRMIDLQDKAPLTHDGYLKMYQLRKPVNDFDAYDVILIDEAQDLTPAVADILLSLNKPKILVGDPHQQIYAFRGAVDSMQLVTATRIFYLTQSFRFGPEISWVAAMCLDLLKNERKKLLVGSSTRGCVSGEKVGPMAIICRTNFTVFSEAVRECCFCNDNMRCAFAGGIDNFGFDVILDILVLFQNHSEEEMEATIQNRLIRRFIRQGFSEFVKFAKKTTDSELLGKIKIVEVFHNSLPGYIKMIRSKCVRDVDLADIIFSTAHKAKGLEFSTVRVANDFNIFNIDGRMHSLSEVSIDERNLLYVAVTRAKKSLILSSTIVKLLELYGDHHLSVISSKVLKEKGVNFKCKVSGEEFEPGSLTLYHEKYVLSDKTTQSAHVLSPETVGNLKQVASFAQILGTNFVQMEVI